MIVLVLGLFVLLTLYSYSYREGMEEDSLSLAMQSIEKASKDVRMDETQRHALENALSYANFIKHMPNQ